MATRGPYQAVVCRLGTQPFEPFDAELLSPLLPHVRIIVSAQIGYNDFDIEWMTRHDIWFCNSRRATADSTANMALFLILAVLRDTSRGEKIFRQGLWRTGLNLSRDPAGLTLGIIGMGNMYVFSLERLYSPIFVVLERICLCMGSLSISQDHP